MTAAVEDLAAAPVPATVDIHCHTFNGADLPVEGFLRHVVLRDADIFDWAKDRLARHADQLVQRDAHGYERERAILDALLEGTPEDFAAAQEPDQQGVTFEEQVDRDLEAFLAEDPDTAAQLGAAPGPGEFGVGPSDLRPFFGFARNLASTRLDIARRLVATYPGVSVFTTMLVDMSYGVDDKPMTTVAQQLELHEKISRLSILGRLTQRDALLLPFAGFDPRREVQFHGALRRVQEAVESGGFAGIKLYPPMGFSPVRNDEPGIDGVLEELYAWCESEDVPLTAHCNRSQGTKTKVNDTRSDPRLWAEVLTAHPGLHLNLGHFGGIGRVSGQPFWPEEISRLATFDHLYADLGCHADLLEAPGRTSYRKLLATLFSGAGGAMRERVMYGSDWSMLLQHPGADGYLADVLSIFDEDQHTGLASGRALAFLGLGETPNRNGTRILDRITSLGADPATWLGAS